MANITTGALPSGTATQSDQLIGNQSGATKRLTLNMTSINGYEGIASWTPTLYGSTTAGTTTYTAQIGYYFKVGGLVTCVFSLGWSGFTGTGGVYIGGLPFTAASLTGNPKYGLSVASYTGFILSGQVLGGNMLDNTNYIRLTRSFEASNTLEQSNLSSSGEIQGSITFIV
jgi:hypothetical protein